MRPDTINWIEASDYDLETARHMLASERYLYVVFMCHLALEKLLKAVVTKVTDQPAPRTHDLVALVRKSGITLGEDHLEFLGKLNTASIPTRYPSDMREAVKEYNRTRATKYLKQTEAVVAWLKAQPILTK